MKNVPFVFKTETSRTLLLSAVIAVLGGFAYLNSLLNPFIWDDAFLVSANLHIRSLAYIPRLFFENVYHQDMIGKFYRPVLMTSFALDYHQWGLEPFGYHITNILIHLGNALLVFGIVRLVFRRELLAFLTAILFVLHPVQTESVTYISGRADPLAAFFCLLALYFFITYIDFDGYKKKLYFGVSVVSFLLALFSKESAAVFPLTFILYEACFRKDGLKGKRSLKYAFYLAALLIYGVIRHSILLNIKGTLTAGGSLPLLERFYLIPPIILTYIKLLLFPGGLHMERSDFLFDRPHYFFDHRVMLALSVLAAIAVFVWLARKRHREALFGFGWFILMLIPVLNIIPINAFVAEHWLYLPSAGFFLLGSSALIALFRFKSIKLCAASFIIVILAMLCALTIRQNYMWRDPVSFYKYTLKFSPLSTRLRTNLGVEYFNLGLYKEAEQEYRKALAAEPAGVNTVNDYINLGAALYWQGKKKESIEAYNNAIRLKPDSPLGYWFMANILYLDNQTKKAIGFYKKAAELIPSNAAYWLTLGNAYQKDKDFKEAEGAYKKALAAYPAFFEARINLGTVYYKQGRIKDAFKEYQEALRLDPESPEAYYNIGNVSAAIGKTEEAKDFWREALKRDPNHEGAKKKLEKSGGKK
ncbi:MAG: tetratricopeptide repeat protein [Candidatus Omnitrophica bacterium]|nr:tetratricopeptide repeat protein [Candidatus Omnitrophota bacterium]